MQSAYEKGLVTSTITAAAIPDVSTYYQLPTAY